MLTPTNIIPRWIFLRRMFSAIPVIRGNQRVKAANIAKTAPMDRT